VIQRRHIRKFADAVAEKFRPHKIILFGSYAYGMPTEDSDVDLLVVMDRTRVRGERMSLRIRRRIPACFPLDLLVRTPKFLAQRMAWEDCFTQEILTKGKVLYEDAHG
jgi:predicted nucleotidyltransferase